VSLAFPRTSNLEPSTCVGRRVALVGLVVVGIACGPATSDDGNTQLARDGTDLVSHEGDTEMLATALVGTTGGGLALASDMPSSGVALSDLGDGARAFFFPRGCVTPSHDATARTVTYTFDDCVGPFGLRKLQGTVRIAYAKREGGPGLQLVISSEGLAIGRATLTMKATAEVTAEGTSRRVAWSSELEGTSARNRAFSRVVDRTLIFNAGESCIEASGRSTGTAGGSPVTVTLDKLKRCRGACPEAGGSVRVEGTSTTLEVAFDGTSQAKLSVNGNAKSIALACAK
jgi:hypothetical protein